MDFIWDTLGQREYLKPKEVKLSDGVRVGFGGTHFYSELEVDSLIKELRVSRAYRLHQTHSKEIVHVTADVLAALNDDASLQTYPHAADGWFIAHSEVPESGAVFLLRTADCLPVIYIGADCTLLIHAGWKGLEQGILAEGMKIARSAGHEIETVLLGPAADPALYEVGAEFGDCFSCSSLTPVESSNKYHFNMYLAAEEQLRGAGYPGEIVATEAFTISNDKFHSYRVRGEAAGRNMSFISMLVK